MSYLETRVFKTNYKWYILALTMLTFGIVGGLERLCLPVLFKEISVDLNLGIVSIGAIWGMEPLAGLFISLPGGLLVDRFGVKRTLTLLCLLGALFCALRGFSTSFLTLAAIMFLFGLMSSLAPGVTPKTAMVWFSRRQLVLTNALIQISGYAFSMMATMLSATVLSPLLGGWRNVMFFLSIPAAIVGLLWIFTAREPDHREMVAVSTHDIPFKQALSGVIRIRDVWFIGLIQLTSFGAYMGLIGYLPLYLRNIGWAAARADGAITVLNGACLIGIMPMALLANRLKPQIGLFLTVGAFAAGMITLPFIQNNGVFVLLGICGFIRCVAPTLVNTLIFDIKGVGRSFGGTAVGLANTVGMIGAFLAPPLGNSMASINPGMPFIFWGIFSAAAIPFCILIRGRVQGEAEAPGTRSEI